MLQRPVVVQAVAQQVEPAQVDDERDRADRAELRQFLGEPANPGLERVGGFTQGEVTGNRHRLPGQGTPGAAR